MSKKYPLIYEINTWVWLTDLSHQYNQTITLGNIPPVEWSRIASFGFDFVWLMGVWERSPFGIQITLQNNALVADFHQALPDYSPADVVGSPYCIRGYQVDPHLGGTQGLATARLQLKAAGMGLILDYVPNHVAPDHPWTIDHPDYFIQGTPSDLAQDPFSFLQIGPSVIARGRDPNFPAWPDVVQLNAYHSGLRQAVIQTLLAVAAQCDGLRVDMAMLMFNSIFKRTWGDRTGPTPPTEFWVEIIQSVKKHFPDLVWMAEAYWDTETELHRQGFDFCYDKTTYDLIRDHQSSQLDTHLRADPAYLGKLVHFTENHDENRAVISFPNRTDFLAALTSYTLPGARLFHEGQLDGRQVKTPVFLDRRVVEPQDPFVLQFYKDLLSILALPAFQGEWQRFALQLEDHSTAGSNTLAWSWTGTQSLFRIVVNLDPAPINLLLPSDLPSSSAHIRLSQAVQFISNRLVFSGPGFYVEEFRFA